MIIIIMITIMLVIMREKMIGPKIIILLTQGSHQRQYAVFPENPANILTPSL